MIKFGKIFRFTLLAIIVFEILSYLGWFWPQLQAVLFWLILAATFLIAIRRLDVALWIVLAELFVGSKGYLFYWTIGDITISIRLALFLTIFLAWVIRYVFKKDIAFRKSNIYGWYIGLLIVLCWGMINGYLRNNELSNIFFDVNGFLYFGLIFVIYQVVKNRERISNLLEVLFASLTAIGIKTLFLLFAFAGQYQILPDLYRWVRDTRVNEVTLIINNFYRIFSQSHIFSLFGAILALTILTLIGKKYLGKSFKPIVFIFAITSLSTLISYSRSFWLSLVIISAVMLYIFIKKYNFSIQRLGKYIGAVIAIVIIELGFIFVFINIPNWIRAGGETTSLASIVEERLTNPDEIGLQSRWNLIDPLTRKMVHHPAIGAGFGTEITYFSEDLRNRSKNDGYYTTYVTEWGYFDLILKIGMLGLIVYILYIWKIAKNGIEAFKKLIYDEKVIVLSLLLGLLALVVTHISTPYLNHPLGIGYLMICAVIFERLKNESDKENT